MSLDKVQSALEAIAGCEALSIQLLRIKSSKKKGTGYAAFSVNLTPKEKLAEFVKEISGHYIDGKNAGLKIFSRVQEYDGTAEGNIIYKLNARDALIKEEYDSLIHALANPEQEADPLSQKLQAYVIQGEIKIDNEETGIKLISMQNPTTTLKHKFWYDKNTFREIGAKVLSLRAAIDVLILDNEIYFFTMASENLFNMKRAYKIICDNKVTMIEQSGILYDNGAFGNVARTGHHPRMFVSFNEQRHQRLKDKKERKRYSALFDIPLKDGKFDTSKVEYADKLVRLLCNKGMVDPFEDSPVEVTGARKWQ